MRQNVKWAIVDWNPIRWNLSLFVRVRTNIWFELENTYTRHSQSATAEAGRELINLIANVHKGQIASSDVYRLFTRRTALKRLKSRFLSRYILKISSIFSSPFQNMSDVLAHRRAKDNMAFHYFGPVRKFVYGRVDSNQWFNYKRTDAYKIFLFFQLMNKNRLTVLPLSFCFTSYANCMHIFRLNFSGAGARRQKFIFCSSFIEEWIECKEGSKDITEIKN